MGAIAGGLSAGLGLEKLFGSSGTSSFQMPGMGTAAGGALGGISGLNQYNIYGQDLGTAQNLTSNIINNPFQGALQSGAGVAGGMYTGAGTNAYNAGANQYGGAGQLQNYAGQVFQTAMDPQNQLYARTLQQTQDQQNAVNAASGVGTTPYGAGIANQNLENFNIDWQNNQLQRQTTGLNAAGTALNTAGNLNQGAAGLQTMGAGSYLQGAGIPYATANSIYGTDMGALNAIGGYGQSAANIPSQQIQQYLAYLGQGNNANSVQNQSANLNNQIQTQGATSLMGGLGAIGGNTGWGLSQYFNPSQNNQNWSYTETPGQTPTWSFS